MERGPVVGLGFGGSSLPPVLTVEEVAELMRIDRKTAYTAIAEGEVPGVRRLGRCIRVSRDVLLRWLADGEGGRSRGGEGADDRAATKVEARLRTGARGMRDAYC